MNISKNSFFITRLDRLPAQLLAEMESELSRSRKHVERARATRRRDPDLDTSQTRQG
jgi:hypothetical protein